MRRKQKGSIYYFEESDESQEQEQEQEQQEDEQQEEQQEKDKDSSQSDDSLAQDMTKRNKIQLIFPPHEFKQRIYSGRQEVWTVLKQFDRERAKFYKVTLNRSYLYIKCKLCESTISLKRNNSDSVWKVQKFQNSHCHKVKSNKKDEQKQVVQFMEQHGLTFQTPGIDLLLQQKFNITKRRFFYIRNKKLDTKQSLEAFLEKLLDNSGKLYQSEWAKNQPAPQFIIYSNLQMQQNYYKFGDCMRFDLTYGLCRLKSSQGKKWNVGMFNGFSQNLSPIVFGVVIMKDQTIQSFKKVFKRFFVMMGGAKYPQTIITDQQLSIQLTLQQLSKQNGKRFIHLLDQFHIIKLLRKKFKKQTQKQDVDLLRSVMYSRDRTAVEDARRLLANKYQGQTWWAEYMRKIAKWSVFYAQKNFYGLSITTSPNEKLHDMLKAKLKYETTIQQIIRKVQALSNQQINRPIKIRKNLLLKCFKDTRLIKLQYKLGPKVFLRFLSYYVDAIKMKVVTQTVNQQNKNIYKIKLGDGTEYPHMVTSKHCQCGIREQEGLPCPHMLCVYRADRSLNFQSVIRQRWLLPDERENFRQISVPKPAKRRKRAR